ncbi:HalOD1 output domain-containing protein [Natrononativus amylolyticus]|uniref:HalOD1 output domain-containing protein n=1 Tax=Natrononativus amylolyticus TaxID=2963434 RepID=UPI003CE53BC2
MGAVCQYSTEKYQTPTTAVVSALTEVRDGDSEDLTPLNDSIDPDALNTLFTRTSHGARIVFEHEGCRIEVRSDGLVTVTPSEEE